MCLTDGAESATIAVMHPIDRIGSREVCERLGIARSTLNYWMLQGKITPAQTIPGPNTKAATYLWDVADVEALLAIEESA